MPSRFAAYERLITEAVDEHMAEPILFEPQAPGGFVVGAADQARPVRTILGVLDLNPRPIEVQHKGQYDGYMPDVRAQVIEISFDMGQFVDRTAWPRKGDMLTAITQDEQPRYQVAGTYPDGMGRAVCVCTPAGKP